MNDDEQKWLDALAGKPSTEKKSIAETEAIAIRRALTARRESLELEAKYIDNKNFEAVKLSLMKAGFLKERENKTYYSVAKFLLGSMRNNASGFTIQRIGALATIVLAISFMTHETFLKINPTEELIFRGDSNITYIIDSNPEQKSKQIIKELENIKAEFSTENLSYGNIMLEIQLNDEVQAYLNEKRIKNIKEIDGQVTIVITPSKSSKK